MAEVVRGSRQLQARLHAISKSGQSSVMAKVAAVARGQMVANMPRRTGTTGGSIQPRNVTARHAELVGSPVVLWIDTGTGLFGPAHRRIVPTKAAVLAFHWQGAAPAGATYRLSGRMTKGSARKFGANSDMMFRRSVAGMKARPFIARSITEAATKAGVAVGAAITNAWNGAA